MTAPLNLVNYVPKLKAINESLAKIGGEISVGPTAHLQFPVTFNISKFTIVGGVAGAESAEYTNVNYAGGKQVTASGNTPFNLLQNPSRVTTHVKYGTTVKLVLSIHFRVKVAKFFNIEVNTPSLDLTYLLYRVREENRTLEVDNIGFDTHRRRLCTDAGHHSNFPRPQRSRDQNRRSGEGKSNPNGVSVHYPRNHQTRN